MVPKAAPGIVSRLQAADLYSQERKLRKMFSEPLQIICVWRARAINPKESGVVKTILEAGANEEL